MGTLNSLKNWQKKYINCEIFPPKYISFLGCGKSCLDNFLRILVLIYKIHNKKATSAVHFH